MRAQRELRDAARAAAITALLFQLSLGVILLFGDWPGLRGSLWELGPWGLAAIFVIPAAMPLAARAHLQGRSGALAYAVPLAFGGVAGGHVAYEVHRNLSDYPRLVEIQTTDHGLTGVALGLVGAAFVAGLRAALAWSPQRARGLGHALLAAWLLLMGAQTHLFAQGIGLFGCKCMLGTILEEANVWLGAAHDLAWVGGAALGGATLAYACHRRPSARAVAFVLFTASALAGLEHHGAARVTGQLSSPTVPADLRLPVGEAPHAHAAGLIPLDAVLVGLEAVHHRGQRVGDTAELSTVEGCRAIADRVVPAHRERWLTVHVAMDARLSSATMRCFQAGLKGAMSASERAPSPNDAFDMGSDHVAWLYTFRAPDEPLRGALAELGPVVSDIGWRDDDVSAVPDDIIVGEALRRR